MPNPAFLKIMNVRIEEYNTYSSEKKEKFQQIALRKLAELQSNPKAYSEFTNAEEETAEDKSQWEIDEENEKEQN